MLSMPNVPVHDGTIISNFLKNEVNPVEMRSQCATGENKLELYPGTRQFSTVQYRTVLVRYDTSTPYVYVVVFFFVCAST